MKFVRFAYSALACAIAALGFVTLAQAQQDFPPSLTDEVRARHRPQLSLVWYETEGDWQGTWSPVDARARDGRYTASWRRGRSRESATLAIQINDGRVVITRTQPDGGACRYEGFFNAAGNVVTGTYTCDWAPTPMSWRASIGSVIAPSRTGDFPRITSVPYLRYEWAETEGDWHGRWIPRNPDANDGVFDARWTRPGERAQAELRMSVDTATGRVTVNRIDPDGRTCTYYGVISNTAPTNVSGTYRCQGGSTLLPWQASLQVPER